MKRLTILIIIFFFNCTDLLTENNLYKSVILRGGSWIEFQNSDVISFLDNDFSLQILVSGMVDNTNNAKVLFSVINEISLIKLSKSFKN